MSDQAKRLKEAREALGLSQSALATRAKMSIRTVRRAEHGEASDRTYMRLMAKLGVNGDTKKAVPAMKNGTDVKSTALAVVGGDTGKGASNMLTKDDLLTAADLFDDEWEGDWPPPGRGPDGMPRYLEQDEHLSAGHEVVSFIESYPTTPVYVKDDPEPGELREHIENFIDSVINVRKAIRDGGFNSRQRFYAQCAFADILQKLHMLGWYVWSTTRRVGKEDEAGEYKVTWTGSIEVTRTAPATPFERNAPGA